MLGVRMDSLLLSCMTLSFTTSRRFIPTLSGRNAHPNRQPVSGKVRRKLGVSPGFATHFPALLGSDGLQRLEDHRVALRFHFIALLHAEGLIEDFPLQAAGDALALRRPLG